MAEQFSIKTENSTNWTAINTDPSAQTDQFRHSFATTSPVTYWKPMGIHPAYEIASSSVAVNDTLNIYLKLETPGTDTSNYAQQSVTVTVFAEQAP
ncbi:MAG: hypothetical protein UV65_C0029G0008 [Parcubacteria group bacterium GW2011_GWF2_43_11]|nr:MAG: hypothetical protein UV65_C0029G0008 [Parcubacteria group bacterium GW2011_GWF2_43_11]